MNEGSAPEEQWLVPVTDDGVISTTTAVGRRPSPGGLVGAALLVAVAIVMVMVMLGSQRLGVTDEASSDPDSAEKATAGHASTEHAATESAAAAKTTAGNTTAESPSQLSAAAITVVERRYQAMVDLDLDAIHADVAHDVRFCLWFHPDRQTVEGCQEAFVDYHEQGGWGFKAEQRALRAHAFGGEVTYSCETGQTIVTCAQTRTHLLLEVAGLTDAGETATFVVANGEIVSIEILPTELGPGFVKSQIQLQERAYGQWLEATDPDAYDQLFLFGRPLVNRQTAARHHGLVRAWLVATGQS